MKNSTGVVGALSTAFTIVMVGSSGHKIGPVVKAPSLEFAGAVVETYKQQLAACNISGKIKVIDLQKRQVTKQAIKAYAAWSKQKTMAA
ncbi:MAG: hypothetical protein EYC62_06810 [Alphaproteobacteria bacterium]|nr:MAG: hypothetical protein EYC62_06810 [Alphaproteobacteria bacterium]